MSWSVKASRRIWNQHFFWSIVPFWNPKNTSRRFHQRALISSFFVRHRGDRRIAAPHLSSVCWEQPLVSLWANELAMRYPRNLWKGRGINEQSYQLPLLLVLGYWVVVFSTRKVQKWYFNMIPKVRNKRHFYLCSRGIIHCLDQHNDPPSSWQSPNVAKTPGPKSPIDVNRRLPSSV